MDAPASRPRTEASHGAAEVAATLAIRRRRLVATSACHGLRTTTYCLPNFGAGEAGATALAAGLGPRLPRVATPLPSQPDRPLPNAGAGIPNSGAGGDRYRSGTGNRTPGQVSHRTSGQESHRTPGQGSHRTPGQALPSFGAGNYRTAGQEGTEPRGRKGARIPNRGAGFSA